MWNWEPTTVNVSGSGICGGEVVTCSAGSVSTSKSICGTAVWFQPGLRTLATSTGILDITGYGVRSGSSLAASSSTLDIGRGLTVINESGIISTDTTVVRVLGNNLYSDTTINKYSDVIITSENRIDIDGGDVIQFPTDTIEGGDSVNTNRSLDGGDAT